MAGGFSTRATIPQFQPEVGGVATYRAPIARTPDVSSGLEQGARQISEATSELGKYLIEQGRHQQVIDSASTEENVKDQFNQIRVDARQLPGNQQADYVKQQTTAVGQKILADPANAHIAGYMRQRIPELQGLVVDDARLYGAEQTLRDQKAQNDALDQKIATNDVAGSYMVGPDGQVVDGAQATAARAQTYARYDALHPQNPILSGANKRDFDTKATLARAQFIARNPDAAHPDLLNNYIEQNRADITPELESQLHNAQTAAVNEPMRQQEAGWTAVRAASIKYQQDFIRQNGHPDMGRLESDAQWKRIAPEDYQRFTGQQYFEPTPPSTLAGYQSQINNANSEDDLAAIKANIGFSAANRILNGRDAGPLALLAEERLRHLKTTAGSADITQTERIRQFYEPDGSASDMVVRARNASALSNAHESAMAIYKARTAGHPQDVETYEKAADAAMKAVPRPAWNPPKGAEAKSATPTPTPPSALTGYSDDQLRKIAEYTKAHPEVLK